jgi:hypothetical protein
MDAKSREGLSREQFHSKTRRGTHLANGPARKKQEVPMENA